MNRMEELKQLIGKLNGTDVPKKELTKANTWRNKIEDAITNARELVENGTLVDDGKKKAIFKVEDLRKYMELAKSNGELAYDLETTGLDPYNDIIVGLCFYTPNEDEERVYVPLNHTNILGERIDRQLTIDEVREVIRDVLSGENVNLITHYGKIEGKFTRTNLGFDIKRYFFDTHIASCLLNENEGHELKELYEKYVLKLKKSERKGLGFADLFGRSIPFNYLPIDVAKIYGADDGYKTYKLYEFQRQYLLDSKKSDMRKMGDVLELEMKLFPILVNMEMRGVELDIATATELSVIFNAEITDAEAKLDEFVSKFEDRMRENGDLLRLMKAKEGKPLKINYNSPKQLSTLIYDVFKCKSVSRKKPRGTGKKEINILKEKHKKGKVFFDELLRYKGLAKLLSTYILKLPTVINAKTNAIHCNFNAYGTVTGRFSSNDPNLQNIPAREKRIRKMFKARDNFYFNASDYSQIEPRILASLPQILGLTKEDGMMKIAYREGRDLYSFLASVVFNKPYEECGDGTEERRATKGVLLGIMYGRTPDSIAKEFDKPKEWGEEIVNLFYKKFPEVRLVMEYVLHHAITYGYVSTIMGRKRRLPDIQLPKDSWEYGQAERQTLNSVIQGSSADITKRAMMLIGENERLKELNVHMLITVHDEIISEIPKDCVQEASEIINRLMVKAGQDILGDDMPIKVDTDIQEVWYGKNLSDELLYDEEDEGDNEDE